MFEPLPVESVATSLTALSRRLGAGGQDDPGAADGPPASAPPADSDLVDAMAAATALAGWADGLVLRLVAVLAQRRRGAHAELVAELGGDRAVERAGGPADRSEVDRFTAAEVAAALRLSQRSAQDRVELALTVRDRQPVTLAALSAGLVGMAHVRALRDALDGAADDGLARQVEGDVLTAGEEGRDREAAAGAGTAWSLGTPGQLGAAVRRRLAVADAESLPRRCEAARRRRSVRSWGLPDGMAVLQVTAPALDVAAAYEQVDARARQSVDAARRAAAAGELPELEVPTLELARVDAALQLLVGTSDVVGAPVPHVSIGIDVLVPLEVLQEVPAASGAAAELPGTGPLPTPVVRALTRSARRARVVPVDARGAVATAHLPAEEGYRPSAALERAVRARDVTCRWPGCRRRAARCDTDHTVPWPEGPTAAWNLASYCRLHHRVKHRAGWLVAQSADGRMDHRSPSGHLFRTWAPSWGAPRGPTRRPLPAGPAGPAAADVDGGDVPGRCPEGVPTGCVPMGWPPDDGYVPGEAPDERWQWEARPWPGDGVA